MAEMNCSCCRYFHVGFGDRIGVCRRYPSFQNRSMNEWCGEFVPKMVELPVVEVNIDKVHVDLPENTATVEVKRRGRPKKGESDVQASE